MTGSRAAIRYAKAILEMAQAAGNAELVNNDMAFIASTIKDNAELSDFIGSPTVKAEAKEATLKEVFAGSQNITLGLFRLLFENKRFGILAQITEQYSVQFDVLNGREEAVVTTAFAMTPELEAKVVEKAKVLSDKELVLKNIIDPSIIGGFILRVGDKQFNASVASSLLTLKQELTN
ncbi:ATP synthase F1 subunit delta [uncultured Flavobacterium sp.]|uniref:ATP synthase F1 subunit delta n=1 Tax=uncultured Flavobacterium sp. TaxID=165435 RepID=UPI0025D7ABFF|nr:ATP synthase F1 subunit delta [uncultured Flavobacterium sp.]